MEKEVVDRRFWINLNWMDGQEIWLKACKLLRRVNIMSLTGMSDPDKGRPYQSCY